MAIVEPMFVMWATHGQPTVMFFGMFWLELDQKRPCVRCRKLFEVNGLICVEIDRLMHELCVLA